MYNPLQALEPVHKPLGEHSFTNKPNKVLVSHTKSVRKEHCLQKSSSQKIEYDVRVAKMSISWAKSISWSNFCKLQDIF